MRFFRTIVLFFSMMPHFWATAQYAEADARLAEEQQDASWLDELCSMSEEEFRAYIVGQMAHLPDAE